MWSFNSRAQLRLIVANPRPAEGLEQAMAPLSPELLERLAQLSRDGDISTLSPESFEQLLAIGLIVPTDQLQEAVYFEPVLDGHWPRLSPALAQQQLPDSCELTVDPRLDLQVKTPRRWPAGLLNPQRTALCLTQPTAPELQLPFCPTPDILSLLTQLQNGQIHPNTLPNPLRELLLSSGVLHASATQNTWPHSCRQARESLQQNGYAIIRGLLNPVHAAALREYIRDLSQGGYFEHSDEHVERRHTIFNHPLMQFLHEQIQTRLTEIVPEAISPSYSILALYHGGSELRRHIDRIQCAWNVSLMLDAEPESAASWPLYIEQGGQIHATRLGLGDLVVYSGTRTPHWRPRLAPGQRVAVGLFHFVAQHFKGKKL